MKQIFFYESRIRLFKLAIDRLIFGMILLGLLSGCMQARASGESTTGISPTPTLNSAFASDPNSGPLVINATVSAMPGYDAPATGQSSPPSLGPGPGNPGPSALDQNVPSSYDPGYSDILTPAPDPNDLLFPTFDPNGIISSTETILDLPSPIATPPRQSLASDTIFDEKLNENWSLEHSTGVLFNSIDKSNPHNGDYAIALTPQLNYGSLTFTVKKESKSVYLRDHTLGFQFWLYSGNTTIGTGDLGVVISGSNQYPYWVWNDKSVTNDREPLFSFTRLYFLDIHRAIPPQTWVQIDVWLDRLQFDPVYKYVTGFTIKNGADFYDTVYIDQVQIVTSPETP